MISTPDSWRRVQSWLPGLLVVIACSAALLGILHRGTSLLPCVDGYFHIRYAEVLRTQGLTRTFPWWQETFLRDHWADKDFMLHLLLIPFSFGNLLLNAKVASVVFASAAMGVFYLTARALRVPWPSAWSLALLASSSGFLFRLGFTRAWVLAMALMLAGTCAILRGRPLWAFLCAALYPSVHISFHLLPCIALFHDLQRANSLPGRRSFRITGWTAAGTLAGVLVNPFFPNDLRLWWVQNFRVLGLAWAGPRDLRLGLELLPRGSEILLRDNLGVFIAMAAAVWLIARTGRSSDEARTLLAVSSGFFALSMLSYRFIESWSPFTLLLAAVVVRDRRAAAAAALENPHVADGTGGSDGSGFDEERSFAPGRARRIGIAALIVVGGAALASRNAVTAWKSNTVVSRMNFAGASSWMKANIPPGETLFHLDWDDFPELFFFNPQFRYLVGLDPTFMYVTDPKRWRLYTDVGIGEVDDLYGPIHDTFRCRWVCAKSRDQEFLRAARRDPRFVTRYEDATATVFSLDERRTLVSHWRAFGWYPDPARRLLDLPLGPEPGSRASEEGDELEPVGPAAGGTEPRLFPGFVDLNRALEVPAPVGDVCGLAEAELIEPGPEMITVGITTDDEVRLYVGGAEVIGASPFRHPPPGYPGGAVRFLDEAAPPQSSHVPERTARVALHEGRNRILVKSCRFGEDFGFFLRAWRADGSPVPEAPPAR